MCGRKKGKKNIKWHIHICMPISCSRTVQQLRATLHQFHQREATAVLQPSHVRPRTRGIYKRGHWVGLHWFWHGPSRMYRSDREGTIRWQKADRSWPAKIRQTDVWSKIKKEKKIIQSWITTIWELSYQAGGNPWLLSQIRGDRYTNAYFLKIQQSDRPLFSCIIVSHFCSFVIFFVSHFYSSFDLPLPFFMSMISRFRPRVYFDKRASFLYFA